MEEPKTNMRKTPWSWVGESLDYGPDSGWTAPPPFVLWASGRRKIGVGVEGSAKATDLQY